MNKIVKNNDIEAAKRDGSLVGAATDGNKARRGVVRGKREQITHTLPPELLAKIDRRSGELGIPRAAYINLALSKALENGV